MIATHPKDVTEAAAIYAGNRPDDGENWALVYTSNRDSGPLDRSNAEIIARALEQFTDDAKPESHSHWAVGHVDGFALRVYCRDGQITEAFRVYWELQERMDDYPILDGEHYSAVQAEDIEEGWKNWAQDDFRRALEKRFGIELEIVANPQAPFGERQGKVFCYAVPNCEAAFRALFDDAANEANEYWFEESSGMYIDVADVVEAVTLEELAPFILENT